LTHNDDRGIAMLYYIVMSKKQAAAATQEFLEEREPALERLRAALAAKVQDPDVVLDDTVDSLVPLWRWVKSNLTQPDDPEVTAPATVPREEWPSWERFTMEAEKFLSMESLHLLDGLVSYLAVVVQRGAPSARWETAHHRIKRYHVNKHPVLTSGPGEAHIFLPVIAGMARAHLRGTFLSPDDEIANYAQAVIDRLNQEEAGLRDEVTGEDEPLVEVEDLGDDPRRGREVELSIREDIAHERSRLLGRMGKELRREDGVRRVIHEDREVFLVATDWSTDQLLAWATRYLEANIKG
jgi:hypothetical protein